MANLVRGGAEEGRQVAILCIIDNSCFLPPNQTVPRQGIIKLFSQNKKSNSSHQILDNKSQAMEPNQSTKSTARSSFPEEWQRTNPKGS